MESQAAHNNSPFKSQEELDEEEENDNYDLNVIPTLNSQSSEYSQPPILSYSYSGISNASSNPQLTMHSSRVYEQTSHFTFLKSEKLYLSICKMINEAKEALFLQQDIILYLLHSSKWSKDQLYDNYYQKIQLYQSINKLLLKNKQKQPHQGICHVCQQQKLLLDSLLCEHTYCIECWRNYIKQKLSNNNVFFSCMNKCENSPVLPHSFVEKYFNELFELYRKMICINYTTVNKSVSYCPSKKNSCDLFCEITQALFDTSVECQCGQLYCFFCREQPHCPATCEDVAKWKKLLNNQEGNEKWIEKNTRVCPSCKTCVEKYIGCSKIKCTCGAQFCYECNSKWDEAHKSNKGQCLMLAKKQSLEERTSTSDFLKVLQTSITIVRTEKKNMITLNTVFEYLKDEWIFTKFHGTRKQVCDAWLALKWGIISLFIYKKQQIDSDIEQQFIQSITKLMQSVEKVQIVANSLFPKQLLAIGDEVMNRREILKKNKQVWLEAWRSQ